MKTKTSGDNKQEAYVDPVHPLQKLRLGNDTPTCLTPPANIRFTSDDVSHVSAAWCDRDSAQVMRERMSPPEGHSSGCIQSTDPSHHHLLLPYPTQNPSL
jgi:hypothetical protein